jgi:hypothetical protein
MSARLRCGLVCLFLVAVAGCTGANDGRGGGSPSGPPACEASVRVPDGFEATEHFEEPYPDHVGVRVGFSDAKKREIHYFAGIPGEFGEGLPLEGPVRVAAGQRGSLLGAGKTWVLAWQTEGPCAAHAVLGHGFGRQEFLDVLREFGVLSG